MGKIIQEQLSGAIIGIAMEVLNELNPGLDEKLWTRARALLLNFKNVRLDWNVSCSERTLMNPMFPIFDPNFPSESSA